MMIILKSIVKIIVQIIIKRYLFHLIFNSIKKIKFKKKILNNNKILK